MRDINYPTNKRRSEVSKYVSLPTGKLPYIPLYIGDWLKDTNCLTLEAIAAWLLLVFKLWEKKGELEISFQQMAILFKKSIQETHEIFIELTENKIFDWQKIDENKLIIFSRRMLREVRLSSVRSEAGKKGGRPKKQSKSKIETKTKQNAEYEYVYEDDNAAENDNEKIKKVGAKKEVSLIFESDSFRDGWENWKQYRKKEFNEKYKSVESEQAAITHLVSVAEGDEQTAIDVMLQSMANGWKGFFPINERHETDYSKQSTGSKADAGINKLVKGIRAPRE
jgi:uncharacterized protein YdaU (DUF1376 family)